MGELDDSDDQDIDEDVDQATMDKINAMIAGKRKAQQNGGKQEPAKKPKAEATPQQPKKENKPTPSKPQ
jgi:hypothetical protein